MSLFGCSGSQTADTVCMAKIVKEHLFVMYACMGNFRSSRLFDLPGEGRGAARVKIMKRKRRTRCDE